MIYLDTSVLPAQLLAEDRLPPSSFRRARLVSSRLPEYETWVRLHAMGLNASHGEDARHLIGRVSVLETAPNILARALDPFPIAVRTLDALHLATMDFLRVQGQRVELASYDERLIAAARALDLPGYIL